MAKPTQKSAELAALIRCGDAARFEIGQAHQRLKQKLDIPLRIRDSLKASPFKWLGGSLVAGFVGSFLFGSRRTKEQPTQPIKKRGMLVGLLMMAFTFAKPALKIYGTKLLQEYLQQQMTRRPSGKDDLSNPPR